MGGRAKWAAGPNGRQGRGQAEGRALTRARSVSPACAQKTLAQLKGTQLQLMLTLTPTLTLTLTLTKSPACAQRSSGSAQRDAAAAAARRPRAEAAAANWSPDWR